MSALPDMRDVRVQARGRPRAQACVQRGELGMNDVETPVSGLNTEGVELADDVPWDKLLQKTWRGDADQASSPDLDHAPPGSGA